MRERIWLYRKSLCEDERGAAVRTTKYLTKKTTPCGYWIRVNGKNKWVSKQSRSRFAYESEDDALFNLIKRTQRRMAIAKHTVLLCEDFLESLSTDMDGEA